MNSPSSLSSDSSDWDNNWDIQYNIPIYCEHRIQGDLITSCHWLSSHNDGESLDPNYSSKNYEEFKLPEFINPIKTVPGQYIENDYQVKFEDSVNSVTDNSGETTFASISTPSCATHKLQYCARLFMEYMEEDISKLMWSVEQQFQECVMTKDSKRQRNHGFSLEEIAEINSVEQKKYKLHIIIGILQHIALMIEKVAMVELSNAKDELEKMRFLRSNISEAFLKLQNENSVEESIVSDYLKWYDFPRNNIEIGKVRKSKRIQAKVIEEEANAYDSTPKSELLHIHSIQDETNQYCFCKLSVLDNMIRCESGSNCIFGVWFHFMCVKIFSEPQSAWFCPGCIKDENYRPLWEPILRKVPNFNNCVSKGGGESAELEEIQIPNIHKKKSTERKRNRSLDGCTRKKSSKIINNLRYKTTKFESQREYSGLSVDKLDRKNQSSLQEFVLNVTRQGPDTLQAILK
ncbi:hypothetical protein cand_029850 [Cryptosporidium andersoni]|uniref:PHD-type domain-containing protein n=1 Tax=Cryptosporidium andersoni TaxID=117008 RepID=A0A1J4MRV2_9CRYT|nr:hypothetical protein cand_029850 [Cryptosporidium andersoni]